MLTSILFQECSYEVVIVLLSSHTYVCDTLRHLWVNLTVACDKSPCTLLWRCNAWNVKLGNFDKSPLTNLKQSPCFAEQENTSCACILRKEALPGKFSEQLEQGWSVHGVHKWASLKKANLWGMIRGQVNLGNMSRAGKPPMKQSKSQYWRVKWCMQCFRNHDNAHGHFWASCFGALGTCTLDRQCLLKDDSGWQIEWGFGHKMNTKMCMQSACWNMSLCWANLRACRSGWHPAVQMCTELLVKLMSLSLRRILTGKTKW
jgi:hypothetical protein